MNESTNSHEETEPAATGEPLRVTPDVILGTRQLARFWWSLTTLVCLIAAVIAAVEGYTGYALVAFAVAISAAINLR